MAGAGVFIPLASGATMHLPVGCVFCPAEDELVVNYLYRRAVQLPLPCEIIQDINVLRHNPWDIVPEAEWENGKYFFTRKEIKHPGGRRCNRTSGNGYWRSAGSDVPIYYSVGEGADQVLIGMRRTLVFHYGKTPSGERTEWAMQEIRLAGEGLAPYPMMRHANDDESQPPCGCTKANIAKKKDGSSSSLWPALPHVPQVETMVEPDDAWLICRIYKKKQRAPRVVIPPTIDNVGGTQDRLIDFLGQAHNNQPSSTCSCTIDPSLEEGSGESPGASNDYNNGEGN